MGDFFNCLMDVGVPHPLQCGWHLPKEKCILFLLCWLGFPLAAELIHRLLMLIPLLILEPAFLGFYVDGISSAPGTLQASGSRRGVLGRPASSAERSVAAQRLWCEAVSWAILTTLHMLI